jgi:MFS family permease
MLGLLFACLAFYAISEGVGSVAWFDILARALPIRQRGRMYGIGQPIGGLGAIGAGAAVGLVLARLSFPESYAVLFTLGGIGLIPSTLAAVLIREPAPAISQPGGGAPLGGRWLEPLVRAPALRRLMACRILLGAVGLTTPFYVVHAREVLQLPHSIIGRFVIAQTIATIVSSAAFGLISQHRGPRAVVRIGIAAALLGPLLALAIHWSPNGWLAHGYPVVFVGLGAAGGTSMIGFTNYVLEIAPDRLRSRYIGLASTIAGATAVAPTLGGWLLEVTSYSVLFGLAAVFGAAGLLFSFGLKPAVAPAPADVQP